MRAQIKRVFFDYRNAIRNHDLREPALLEATLSKRFYGSRKGNRPQIPTLFKRSFFYYLRAFWYFNFFKPATLETAF